MEIQSHNFDLWECGDYQILGLSKIRLLYLKIPNLKTIFC